MKARASSEGPDVTVIYTGRILGWLQTQALGQTWTQFLASRLSNYMTSVNCLTSLSLTPLIARQGSLLYLPGMAALKTKGELGTEPGTM